MKVVRFGLKQKGAVLIIFVFLISLALMIYVSKVNNPVNLKAERDKKTELALAMAKQALLSYAAKPVTGEVNGASLNCNSNCARPGDLPCPDLDNDGDAEVLCGANQADRIGRLPWKTLGLGDIRDGAGERFWYAVSTRYKNNPRVLPLNTDSLGTISLRNSAGIPTNVASTASGLTAVIISPGQPLTRSDGLVQNRTNANQNIVNHYLDIAFSEDNADFFDASPNGFISGPVSVLQNNQMVTLSNDVVLPITRDEMNVAMEARVLMEVMQAVLYSFCPGRSNAATRTCGGSTVNDYLSDPANITDNTCLGNGDIPDTDCISDSSISVGRIAVGGNTSANGIAGWKNQDSNSILRGEALHNWFQQNGWRELIIYARAPACAEATKNCTGSGYLTLNGSLTPITLPSNASKQVVLISSGIQLLGQIRATSVDKSILSNYLEGENLIPLDDIYARYQPELSRNDTVMSIP